MYMKYYTPRDAAEALGYNVDYLRQLAKAGKIDFIMSPGGQRRYDVDGYIRSQKQTNGSTICYCRVSGKGQSDHLASQVEYMRSRFPDAEIITDFGSGINFKRKGLRSILERVLRGDKLRVIVAHRDRLARFGGEVIQFLVEQNGGEVVVLDETIHSPEEELTADLLAILHVFSCRMYGLRRYRDQIKKDTTLTDRGTEIETT